MASEVKGLTQEARGEVASSRSPARGLLLLLAAISYTTWSLASWIVPDQLDPVRSYVSELSARQEPMSWLFRTTDGLTGVLVLCVVAWTLWRCRPAAPGRAVWWWIGWLSLLVFGLSTFWDAVFAMDCAPSLDAACAAAEKAGAVSLSHQIHTYTSSIAGFGLTGSLAFAWYLTRRELSLPARFLAVLVVTTTAWLLVEILFSFIGQDTRLGIPQRIQLGLGSMWLAAIGVYLTRHPDEL